MMALEKRECPALTVPDFPPPTAMIFSGQCYAKRHSQEIQQAICNEVARGSVRAWGRSRT